MSAAVDTSVTWLFVPGDRPDRHDRAFRSSADVVVIDLEDAVAPDRKDAAREHARATLATGTRAVVRINGASTQWHEGDAALAAALGVPVMLPKAEDVQIVEQLRRRGVREIVGLVETPAGLLAAPEIARACDRLAFGNVDLAAAIGVDPSDRAALASIRMSLVVASAAARRPAPLDGVTTELSDHARTLADARDAARTGFGGKLCVHPEQVAAAARGFAPGRDEVRWARRVLDESATGVVALDGEMIDAPVLARARALLARAGRRTPDPSPSRE